jgi:hypothetical protein
MSSPTPPQLEAAKAQVSAVLEQLEGRKIDLDSAPWAEIEKALVKVLQGPFRPDVPEHQVIALGLAAGFGARLLKEQKAFWFPDRESPEGASVGFSEALIKLSPFGAVVDALGAAKLERLDDVAKDIRTSLAQVKFSAGAAAQPMQLAAEDYMRLFDPGFVQVVALDPKKAEEAWNKPPERLSADVRDAISRTSQLPPQVKQQLEQQLVGALQRLEPGKSLLSQLARAPRVIELMGLLTGASASTGSAPEEFWAEVALPLLFIGNPASFPEIDDEELGAAKQGVDPLFLMLEVVPYQFKAAEEGLMGAFPGDSLGLPHPAFSATPHLRLIKVGLDVVKGPLAAFDPAKTKDTLKRFGEHLAAKTGPVAVRGGAEAKQMFDAALALLADFKRVVDSGKDVCVRRLTEAEAASEPALNLVRQSMSGPRIILAP